MRTSTCKDCGQTIRWVFTEKLRRMALDPDPNERGNVVIVRSDFQGNEHCKVIKKGEDATTALYMPHKATCPALHARQETS